MMQVRFSGSGFALLLNVIIIVWQYIFAISILYLRETEDVSDWILFYLLRFYCRHPETGCKLSGDEFENWHKENLVHSVQRPGRVNRIKNLLARIKSSEPGRPLSRRSLLTWMYLWNVYNNAFLGQLPSLLFNMSYSATQLVFSRTDKPAIQGSRSTRRFWAGDAFASLGYTSIDDLRSLLW
jgi:hypothetical protein